MGDSANWEFAATVAAVTLGLGGLLLFTLIAAAGAWRMFGAASEAAREAAEASAAMRELARQITAESRTPREQEGRELEEMRRRIDSLAEQHTRLQDAFRALEGATPREGGDAAGQHLRDVESAVRRLEETVSEIAVAIGDLNQRMP